MEEDNPEGRKICCSQQSFLHLIRDKAASYLGMNQFVLLKIKGREEGGKFQSGKNLNVITETHF